MARSDNTEFPDTLHPRARAIVQQQLDAHPSNRARLRFHYGDVKTGQAWGDVETGRVGRSTGTRPIPLVVHNARSMGGGALSGSIVKIDAARKNRGGTRDVLFQHPDFHDRRND